MPLDGIAQEAGPAVSWPTNLSIILSSAPGISMHGCGDATASRRLHGTGTVSRGDPGCAWPVGLLRPRRGRPAEGLNHPPEVRAVVQHAKVRVVRFIQLTSFQPAAMARLSAAMDCSASRRVEPGPLPWRPPEGPRPFHCRGPMCRPGRRRAGCPAQRSARGSSRFAPATPGLPAVTRQGFILQWSGSGTGGSVFRGRVDDAKGQGFVGRRPVGGAGGRGGGRGHGAGCRRQGQDRAGPAPTRRR